MPKPDKSGNYDWSDLRLGMNLDVYSRVFRIADCDDFTKAHFANEGLDVGVPEAFPDDPFTHTRAMINMK